MKNRPFFPFIVLVLAFLVSCEDNSSTSDETSPASFPCEDGFANGIYPCENMDLYAHLDLDTLGAPAANDIWGWTDPSNGNEYALIGLFDGVGFVNITDPNNPVIVGKLNEYSASAKLSAEQTEEEFPACVYGIGTSDLTKIESQGSTWRDVKVYNNHAFVVADGQIHGMQVFDLTKLRDYDGTIMEFSEDAHYDQLGNAHNIAINEETGFAYAIGVTSAEVCGSRNGTGLHIIDISSPLNPTFAGCYIDPDTEVPGSLSAGVGYIHDAQCVTYNGSDADYTGTEVCFNSAEGAVVITDVSDKENPATIGFSGASEMQYSHQGWLTEDHSYFLMNDELDEGNLGRNTKTYIWDVKDLENPTFIGHYTHTTPTIDHNLYVKDNYVYQSNYTSGLRVLELGDLDEAELIPTAYFDTKPNTQAVGYDGSWSNYPFFESGVIVVSDITAGLFILRPDF